MIENGISRYTRYRHLGDDGDLGLNDGSSGSSDSAFLSGSGSTDSDLSGLGLSDLQ